MASRAKSSEALKVVVRCRPMSRKEEAAGYERLVAMDVKLGQVTIRNPKASPGELAKTFTFDAVYDASSKQADLYDETARPLVDSVLQGFNGTLFAYGQTGTGKTYTMQGAWADPERRGVIPNSFEHIFTHISRSQNQQYLVRASYLEIYQEEIRDLLAKDQSKKMELKENPETGVYIKDLSSFVTKNVKEIEHVMNLGNQTRSVGSTNMNEYSSRSHTIFVITVECSERGPDGEDHIRVGKLNLVDLAGSERQSKMGAQGERPKEASKINLSLSALGNVISALVDGKSTHVPYRDSKLTRLLQDSLGGNAKTIMVATLGPASHSYDESLSTLRFANRAKNIKNKPRVNEDPKDTLLREFQEEITRLKAQLEKRGMLSKKRRRNSRRKKALDGEGTPEAEEMEDNEDGGLEKNMKNYLQEQKERLEEEKAAIQDDHSLVSEEKQKLLEEKQKMIEELRKEQEATELLATKYKAMESKLLIGGRNIMDHTNEQQKMLELKRQEINEQKRREREMQQEVLLRDEETMELRETFTSLQQEVEIKTKKLKKLYAKLQAVKAEIQDQHDEYIRVRQDLEEAQNEQTRELKLKYLIIENFIPPEEKNKIMNRLYFDCEEDQWKFQPLVLTAGGSCRTSTGTQMKKRPTSAVGYKRPISQYARLAMSVGSHPRYRAENIMFLELDVSPPAVFEFEVTRDPSEQDPRLLHLERLMRLDSLLERPAASRVRKSRSWCQTPRSLPSSTTHVSLASSSQHPSTAPAYE
ncbi:kinesin-like protein KIF3C isoform X2 [Hemicordylus capensis]|uniref:kinesin-like protein KIF3C isoform X2 n=1 Tax=Hemicordylus capensis TaxID=884348 RepID=UPI00230395ED|nr:kinesin-like protein KIF3C isoform X2 [Hemicordylus capensis]